MTFTDYLAQSLAWVFLAMLIGGLLGNVVIRRKEDQ